MNAGYLQYNWKKDSILLDLSSNDEPWNTYIFLKIDGIQKECLHKEIVNTLKDTSSTFILHFN